MKEDGEDTLLALGRELSDRLAQDIDPQTAEALNRARQRALRTIAAPAPQAVTTRRGWLPAALGVGTVAATAVSVVLLMNTPRPDDERKVHLPPEAMVTAEEAPWLEDPDMLENMEFVLWLDMAGPEDAG